MDSRSTTISIQLKLLIINNKKHFCGEVLEGGRGGGGGGGCFSKKLGVMGGGWTRWCGVAGVVVWGS